MRTTSLILLIMAAGCRAPTEDTGPDLLLDSDGDGIVAASDCDDEDASVFPGADENCDGLDQDCDEAIDENPVDGTLWYADSDGDGYGDSGAPVTGCDQPDGHVANADDCDDLSADFHPSAAELDCEDPNDYNCDGSVGFSDADADGWPACQDCNDDDRDISPGEPEVCDGAVDENCDGSTDEAGASGESTWYADDDADGFGDFATAMDACDQPTGYVLDASDCNDTKDTVYPGADEVCDGNDSDCDGTSDENAIDQTTWYADNDGDGHGWATTTVSACTQPAGFSAASDDCDDSDNDSFPGATEECDLVDNDCNGSVDEGYDTDSDGVSSCGGDCDDTDDTILPGADETCDDVDQNCNGVIDDNPLNPTTWYADSDADLFGDAAVSVDSCEKPTGFADNGDDCDDLDRDAYPGAVEACDQTDNNCDGTADEGFDTDADGFTTCAGDCDDTSDLIKPGVDEVCDGEDNDCDGDTDEAATNATTWYVDYDDDGFGNALITLDACDQPNGFAANDTDCNDTDVDTNPSAAEIWYDGEDRDCDTLSDFDQDGDGADAYLYGGTDCDDNDASIGDCGTTQASAADSCEGIHTLAPALTSGMFWVDPDADGDTSNAIEVYCNMADNDGGWTLAARMVNGSWCHTGDVNAVGALTDPAQPACAKLSDAQIRDLYSDQFWLSCGTTTPERWGTIDSIANFNVNSSTGNKNMTWSRTYGGANYSGTDNSCCNFGDYSYGPGNLIIYSIAVGYNGGNYTANWSGCYNSSAGWHQDGFLYVR